MIKFLRYDHVNDLISYYAEHLDRHDIENIIKSGLLSPENAENFSKFIWDMVEQIHQDEEDEVAVLGSTDNTEMLPDISYEITRLMKDSGYYSIWQKVSDEEMG
ncbi:hypothetical protein [Agaribacterium sp. ZY112]|uniref:hypothetical protein n=1 Tax=Agaribacterium sp. ZY112 TaxID=3233574 RepID=UPI003524DD4E